MALVDYCLITVTISEENVELDSEDDYRYDEVGRCGGTTVSVGYPALEHFSIPTTMYYHVVWGWSQLQTCLTFVA